VYNVTHDDYSFAERVDQEHWVVHLTTGKYEGTYYCYDRVQIIPPAEGWNEDDDTIGTLRFNYGLIESPLDLDELSNSEDFNEYIGAVLQHIIEDSFQSGKYKIGDEDGKPRDNNPT